MPAPEEAPEQVIRRWLDQNGPATVGLGALAQSWKLDRLGGEDRREIAAALDAAGVMVEPPLEEAARRDKLTLSVAAEPEALLEPEPEPTPEPEPAPEPEREPEPEPEPAAPVTTPRPATPARSRRAPLRRFRHLLPQSGQPRPAPPPLPPEPEPPSLPPEPVPGVEPEMPPGIDPDYQPPPEPEIPPAPEPPPEPEIPPAPDPAAPDEEPGAEDDDPLARMAADPASTARIERRRRRQERRASRGPRRPRRPKRRREADAQPDEPEAPAEPDTSTSEPAPSSRRPIALRLIPAALALMVVGSLGPWAENILVTDYGVDRAGYVVMALALVAGLLILLHARAARRSPLPLLAALLATASVVVVAADFRELVDDQFVGPAWGLYAAFAGSAALVALSMSLLAAKR